MFTTIRTYLSDDHRRLEDALRRATLNARGIEPEAYSEFRAGLLRHIAMEEKVLLPAAREAAGGEPLPVAARLRRDHAALAALLVMTPTDAIVAAIRAVLASHNPLEEGPDGVYARCEQLAGAGAQAVLQRLEAQPPVLMAPYADSPIAKDSARLALSRAGYDLKF